MLAEAVFKRAERTSVASSELPPIPRVSFVSPDATGQEFIAQFKKFCDDQTPRCTLRTLSLSSGQVQSNAINYLENLDYDKARIAELSEDESAFGESQLHPLTGNGDPKHWVFSDPEHVFGLSLHFPRDMSSLRSLSDVQNAKVAQSGSKYIAVPESMLLTQLKAREPIDRDSPAPFGVEQEAAQAAHSLSASVQELRDHRIRAVVISASNPLDRIYLLEYLHNQLPNIRVVTVDGDELELDRPHFVDLTGTIAVSTLPVISGVYSPNGSMPTSPPMPFETSQPISFESSRQEGEFLAIDMLLDPDQSSSTGIESDPKTCYSISVVGEEGFRLMPLERKGDVSAHPQLPCLLVDAAAKVPGGAQLPSKNPGIAPSSFLAITQYKSAPGFFRAFLLTLIVLSGLHFFSLLQARNGVEAILSYPHKLKGEPETRRLYLLMVINNQILLLNLLGVRLSLRPSLNRVAGLWRVFWLPVFFGLLVISASVTFALLLYFFRELFRHIGTPKELMKDKDQIGVNLTLVSIFMLWTAWMIWWLPAFQRDTGIFLERVTHLNEGLSPVMPITAILLGYSLWAWMQLKRLNWSASRRIDLQLTEQPNRYLYERVENVMEVTEALSPREQVVTLLAVGVVIFSAIFLWNSLSGFDGLGFHLWIVVWGFAMLLLTVMTACYQARAIWNKLEKLLDWLEERPPCA